jgi:hypothetical protein
VPVSLVISTILIDTGYLAGSKAQLYLKRNGAFERVETQTVTNPGFVITVNFAEEVTGPFRMVIRDSSNQLLWRSAELQPHSDGSPFRYTLVSVDQDRTTLTGAEMTEDLELPMVEDIEDLDEDLVIEKVTVVVHDDHISVMPRGKVAKGDEWTILKSDFDIKYKMKLSPSTSIRHTRMLGITSVDFQMNFSNPITGIGANCVKDNIRTQVRDTLRTEINNAIREQLSAQAANLAGDNPLANEITATVLAVRMIQTGTQTVPGAVGNLTIPVHSLQLEVEASIPSQLIAEQTSSRGGCLGLLLLSVAAGSAALISLLIL